MSDNEVNDAANSGEEAKEVKESEELTEHKEVVEHKADVTEEVKDTVEQTPAAAEGSGEKEELKEEKEEKGKEKEEEPAGPTPDFTLFDFKNPVDVNGGPSQSPYSTKVALYLKFISANFEYGKGALNKGPRNQIPYLKHKEEIIPDSDEIISYLASLDPANDLDAKLSPQQKAISHFVTRTVSTSVYHAMLYYFVMTEPGWNYFSNKLGLNFFVKLFAKGSLKDKLEKFGYGRLTVPEVTLKLKEDFRALDELLGENKFIHGDTPTAVDASVGSFAVHVYESVLVLGDKVPELKEVLEYRRIHRYALRIAAEFLPGSRLLEDSGEKKEEEKKEEEKKEEQVEETKEE